MARIIRAAMCGKNIPSGCYDLKAISGTGALKWNMSGNGPGWKYEQFGVEEDDAKEFSGMFGKDGGWFSLERSVEVEIMKAKVVTFDD